MKSGYYLMCKKCFEYSFRKKPFFYKGEEYMIYENIKVYKEYDDIVMLDNDNRKITLNLNPSSIRYIWKYFYEPLELRNNKLKTIL